MTATDGSIVGTTRIVDNGSPACRFNLVLVAEGYRQTELGQFATDAQRFVDVLFATPPFDALQTAFNVYRVDVSSTDSGADDPAACGGTGATPATFFDASFCNSGIQRLLLVDATSVVNGRGRPGAAVASDHRHCQQRHLGRRRRDDRDDVDCHGLGERRHPRARPLGLRARRRVRVLVGLRRRHDADNHPAVEPTEPNVTIDSNRATIKWGDLVLAATPMPTTSNANCAVCDPQPNPLPAGTVGAFEGAHYYHCDAFRPEFDCMMRNLTAFCAVCRRRIRQTLEPFIPPSCAAPVFDARPWWICILYAIVYVIVLAALWLQWIFLTIVCIVSRLFGSGDAACARATRVRCQIKQVKFRLLNCGKGNSDPCLGL